VPFVKAVSVGSVSFGATALHAAHRPGEDVGTAIGARSATVWTSTGQVLIDLASGGFGYGHPEVCARVSAQLRVMPLASRLFVSRPLASLVARMAQITPGDLSVTYPCNSAAEAVEGALKLARGFNRSRPHVVAAVGAYHGSTLGALSVCGVDDIRRPIRRLPVRAKFVPYGDSVAMQRAIDGRTAAVIVEPVAAGSGVRVPPDGYLGMLRAMCDGSGALLIADETTTCLGRTGERFAVDYDSVVPDILVLGGALGGGVLPAAAYVTTSVVNGRIYGRRDPAFHGSTTGGNPAACVAALATLDVIEAENVSGRCREGGKLVMEVLRACQLRYPTVVAAAAGRGYLAGLQLREQTVAKAVCREALAQGVLVRLDSPLGGTPWIGIRPPLLAATDELVCGLERLELAIAKVVRRPTSRSSPGT
jgi:putrescine aminotransferase